MRDRMLPALRSGPPSTAIVTGTGFSCTACTNSFAGRACSPELLAMVAWRCAMGQSPSIVMRTCASSGNGNGLERRLGRLELLATDPALQGDHDKRRHDGTCREGQEEAPDRVDREEHEDAAVRGERGDAERHAESAGDGTARHRGRD